MATELTARSPRPRKVALVIPQRRKRKTPLARRRRLNSLIRELEHISAELNLTLLNFARMREFKGVDLREALNAETLFSGLADASA